MQRLEINLRIERNDGTTVTYNLEREYYFNDYRLDTLKEKIDDFLKNLESDVDSEWDD